jgi:hypothetical protein
MIISYHNVCPYCGKINKVDITMSEVCSGKALVTCAECSKLYVFVVSTKRVEE